MAYASGFEASPRLFFVPKPDTLTHLDAVQPSHPPISDLSDYPFLTYSLRDLVSLLESYKTEPVISSHHLLVADKQTSENNSLLYVKSGYGAEKTLEAVRLDASYANAIPVAVEIATLDMKDIQNAVDDDAVYRGGHSHSPPKQGKPAPRKQLVGKDRDTS